MPRTDPPPRPEPVPPRETLSTLPETDQVDHAWDNVGGSPSGSGPAGVSALDDTDSDLDSIDVPIELDDVEITLSESEVSLSELGVGSDLPARSTADNDLDVDPRVFERPTVIPPVPEHEYVAQMMRSLPESERSPDLPKAHPIDSAAPTLGRPPAPADLASLLDANPATASPLSLDLTDTVPPLAHRDGAFSQLTGESVSDPPYPAAPEQTGVHERSAFPTTPPAGGLDSALSFAPSEGGALQLVGARAHTERPAGTPSVTMREVRDRFDVGDFSGALVLAEGLLEQEPENADALLYAEHCRDVLKQMYLSRLGGVRRVPQVAMGPEELRWLALDHRAGFLLSLVDGRSSVDEIIDMSGMPEIEALRVLMQLLQQNVVRIS